MGFLHPILGERVVRRRTRAASAERRLHAPRGRVVQVWDRARTDVKEKAEAVERRIKAIRQRIDRLDNAFLYEQSIDIDTYDRHKERLTEG